MLKAFFSLGKLEVSSPKIFINLTCTYKKLHEKGKPYRFVRPWHPVKIKAICCNQKLVQLLWIIYFMSLATKLKYILFKGERAFSVERQRSLSMTDYSSPAGWSQQTGSYSYCSPTEMRPVEYPAVPPVINPSRQMDFICGRRRYDSVGPNSSSCSSNRDQV